MASVPDRTGPIIVSVEEGHPIASGLGQLAGDLATGVAILQFNLNGHDDCLCYHA